MDPIMPSPLSPDELIPDYIDGRLRCSGSLTRGEIAEAFGVSHDTAQRAIAAFMRRWPQAMRRTRHAYIPQTLPYVPVRDASRSNAVLALAKGCNNS
jgi:hypothetical protein